MERRTTSSSHAAERPVASSLLDYDTIIELSVEFGAEAVSIIEAINS